MAPALVLLHGFTNTGASWDGVVAGLGERYRPLAPDIRGHGMSSAVTPVDLASIIDDVAALTGEEETFTLAGYSMGGRLALHAAFALAPRVDRLVLIGASPGLAQLAERATRVEADARLADEIESGSIEAFAARWAQTLVLAGQPADVKAAVDVDRRRNTPQGLARALRGVGTGALPSLWDRLPQVDIPVELIVGARDQKFRATAERMVAALPAARRHVVAGAGHAVHLEDPGAVAAIIAGTNP
jgi:2-succinyl-6-hydroxy-2,4-cyclohexadiene-1-carboxylate synthase